MILGLALTLAYVPGWTGAYIPTGWAVLSLVLPWTLWKGVDLSPFHLAGLVFLCWAAASAFWSPSWEGAVWSLWTLTILGLAFRFGPSLNFPHLLQGLALGLGVSSILVILQVFRIEPVWQTTIERSSGLFFSPVILGSVSALVLLGLLSERLWWYTPLVIPSLVLSGARGAWVALSLGLASRWLRGWALLGLIPVTLFICFSPSEVERATIWFATLRDLTLWGHGAGSLSDVWVLVQGRPTHPGFAHNEVLDLLYQFGLPAVLIFWMASSLLDRSDAPEFPLYIAFLALAAYSGPLHHPLLGLLGAAAAGRLAACPIFLGHLGSVGGPYSYIWRENGELQNDRPRSNHIPV